MPARASFRHALIALVLCPSALIACGGGTGEADNVLPDATDDLGSIEVGTDDTAAPPDTGSVEDTSSTSDTSGDTTSTTDTASATDAASTADTTSTTDATSTTDTTSTADTTSMTDTTSTTDTATALDTSSTADTASASDTAIKLDTATLDTSVTDTGTAADTSATDTGSSADTASSGEAGGSTPLELSAGGGHTCARFSDRTVKCWGRAVWHALGTGGASPDITAPAGAVFGLTTVEEIVAGGDHTCARLGDASMKCWGRNDNGELGLGTGGVGSGNYAPPTTVVELGAIKQIALGTRHSCALLTTGDVKCWGENEAGQLGNGVVGYAFNKPVDTKLFGSKVVQLSTGGGATGTLFGSTCGVLDDATVKCWGANYYGQMGTGTAGGNQTIPALVPDLKKVKSVHVGFSHACALLEDQTVKCWGRNNLGQIGMGSMSTTVHQPTPVTVIGLTKPVVELSVGGWHACARMNDGVVKCWGSNEGGQIGDGGLGAGASRATPATVVGLPSPTAISAGGLYTCGRASSGWHCWGDNTYGQLGIGSKVDQTTPTPVKF